MDISSLIVGGIVLITVLIMEMRNRPQQADEMDSKIDRQYLTRRWRRRRLVHIILGIIACLAIAAGVFGRGGTFLLLWAAVPLLIVLVVLLAFADAYQTYRYHEQKLPEVRKRSLANMDASVEETD